MTSGIAKGGGWDNHQFIAVGQDELKWMFYIIGQEENVPTFPRAFPRVPNDRFNCSMTEPRAYQWDFDKSPFEGDSGFTTFSVGVYQWLPKASGKGLKKSKTIRVNGYVAEPNRVYDKARELCRKFNAEGVAADNPPVWVQRQYSVPKPSDLIIERLSDDLTGNQVRTIRNRVMQESLIPLGFVKGKGGTYVREHDDQIHLVYFQASKYGHEYFVNLGFHYSFIPPFFNPDPTKPNDFHLLDCVFNARLGCLLASRRDDRFAYGNDRDVLKGVFAQNAADCVDVFAQAARTWNNPEQWVSRSVTRPATGWWANCFEMFVVFMLIHFQQFEKAKAQLKDLCECSEIDTDNPYYAGMLEKARRKLR